MPGSALIRLQGCLIDADPSRSFARPRQGSGPRYEQGTLIEIMPKDLLGPTPEEVQLWLRFPVPDRPGAVGRVQASRPPRLARAPACRLTVPWPRRHPHLAPKGDIQPIPVPRGPGERGRETHECDALPILLGRASHSLTHPAQGRVPGLGSAPSAGRLLVLTLSLFEEVGCDDHEDECRESRPLVVPGGLVPDLVGYRIGRSLSWVTASAGASAARSAAVK